MKSAALGLALLMGGVEPQKVAVSCPAVKQQTNYAQVNGRSGEYQVTIVRRERSYRIEMTQCPYFDKRFPASIHATYSQNRRSFLVSEKPGENGFCTSIENFLTCSEKTLQQAERLTDRAFEDLGVDVKK